MKKSNLSSDGISPLESSHNVNQNGLSEEGSKPTQVTIINPHISYKREKEG
jgi:hypothetical protein